MMTPVQLPDWVEQPVPEYELNPIHDAIGKFLIACKGMETWLTILYTDLGDAETFAAAERLGVGIQLERLTVLTQLVPERDRANYARAMTDAGHIVELRHGVIHGIGWPDTSETRWQTKRPTRGAKSQAGESWTTVDYDRGLLIGAGRRAAAISGFIQTRAASWPDRG